MKWDAENRLVSMNIDGQAALFTFTYDYLGRRITRKRGNTTYNFHYDGWNLLTFYTDGGTPASGSTLNRTYTWGLDLSGSMQGAGGVGGLLVVDQLFQTSDKKNYPLYDGNGNVTQYIDDTGTIRAQYEYDPFGRIIAKDGDRKNSFRHLFSTKFRDYYTGLYYYGYRYYDPVTGRWPSRDPIEENGGLICMGWSGMML